MIKTTENCTKNSVFEQLKNDPFYSFFSGFFYLTIITVTI